MLRFTGFIIYAILVPLFVKQCYGDIHDPMGIFCGSKNCYDLLGVKRGDSPKEIKKAYRKLSLTMHPDKNKDENATEVFRIITKAYEVVDNNESRTLFDYYLDHPRDYFKVSGHHYYRNLPKTDVWVIFLVVLGLVSWFMHSVQLQRYQKAVQFMKHAVLNNIGPKNGGSKETQEMYQRALALYDEAVKEAVPVKGKGKVAGVSRTKLAKDEIFQRVVEEVVANVKVEGGHRKPTLSDLWAVRFVLLPHTFYLWACKYYRRNISTVPFSEEEKEELAEETVGRGTWADLSPDQRAQLIRTEVWKPEVRNAVLTDAVQRDADDDNDTAVKSGFLKASKKVKLKKNMKLE